MRGRRQALFLPAAFHLTKDPFQDIIFRQMKKNRGQQMDHPQDIPDLQLISRTVPYGMIRISSAQTPQITYISESMKDMLGADVSCENAARSLELHMQSVYMLITPEDRSRFSLCLKKAAGAENAVSDEFALQRLNGDVLRCLAWVSAGESDELEAVFIDVSEWSSRMLEQESRRYIQVLSAVYEDIFEFDYAARTVKCIYSRRSPMLRWIRNVPMSISEATSRWILHKAAAEDRERLRSFFSAEADKERSMGVGPSEIHYCVLSSDSTTWQYMGIFVKTSPSVSLFCCRKAYEDMQGHRVHSAFAGNGPEIRIRTFGYFDVFVDGKAIAFRNQKSKELFALLVDRRGGFVSSEEAISFLWEDAPADQLMFSRYRKVALRLKKTLEEYGITGAVESVNGKRRIVPERVSCDLFDYLSGKEEHSQLFKGSYLTNYSWAETTLAELQLSAK